MAMRLVKKDEFSIVKDTVCRLSKSETPRAYFEGKREVDVLYFTKHGRYIASQTIFTLSSVGDTFYLVLLRTKKEKLVFAYHAAMYTCTEVDEKV